MSVCVAVLRTVVTIASWREEQRQVSNIQARNTQHTARAAGHYIRGGRGGRGERVVDNSGVAVEMDRGRGRGSGGGKGREGKGRRRKGRRRKRGREGEGGRRQRARGQEVGRNGRGRGAQGGSECVLLRGVNRTRAMRGCQVDYERRRAVHAGRLRE